MAIPSDKMPRLDLNSAGSNLSPAQISIMKKIEETNRERVQALKKLRTRNILTGWVCAGGVLGIYLYSIFAVKQERLFDELDEASDSSKS